MSVNAVNCRKQKMKCRLDNGNTCRRCHRAGVPCIFVPRANAAGLPGTVSVVDRSQLTMGNDVLQRLKAIEDHLGFGSFAGGSSDTATVSGGLDGSEEDGDDVDPVSTALWEAVRSLRRCCPPTVNPVIWHRKTIKYLWSTYVSSSEYHRVSLTCLQFPR